MNRSVEQALTSLIPRHNGPLPPELLDLASSLLAQSRHRASNLKPEEEIGRTYACANIACERLKKTLNLPKIEPRPPCPPRIYSKLYAYLSTAIPATKRRQTIATATASNPSTPSKPLPSRPTPTKERSLAPFKTTPSRSARKRSQNAGQEIAPWIHPFIRALCRDLNAPAAAPHILAGVTSVLTLPSPDDGKEGDGGRKLAALIAGVYFFVRTKLVGEEMSGKGYLEQRKGLLVAMERVRGDGDGDWEGWEDIRGKDVDGWLLEIERRGWLGLDWFTNIVEGVGVDVREGVGEDEDSVEGKLDEEVDREMLKAGLGTMMQDRVDYLSERKREEYRVWKEGILRKMDAIEAEGTPNEMDTSDG